MVSANENVNTALHKKYLCLSSSKKTEWKLPKTRTSQNPLGKKALQKRNGIDRDGKKDIHVALIKR